MIQVVQCRGGQERHPVSNTGRALAGSERRIDCKRPSIFECNQQSGYNRLC